MYKILTLFSVLFIVACSSAQPVEDESDGIGSFITGRDEQGINLLEFGQDDPNDALGLPVNALLWRAALDILAIIPLSDIDVFGGTIITDWYQIDLSSPDRIKIVVFVLDRELRSDALRAIVYQQKQTALGWHDHGIDADFGLKLEELILTRARELRVDVSDETVE